MANDSKGFGTPREGSTYFSLTHGRNLPCDGENHPCPIQDVKARQAPVVVNHAHYDDAANPRFIEIHAYPIFNHNGTVTEIIECAADINERHQAEKAL